MSWDRQDVIALLAIFLAGAIGCFLGVYLALWVTK